MLGAVVSSMVNVAVVVLVLPQSSLAVNVTVSLPVAPQASLRPVLLWLQVTPLQASVATAPPLLDNQAVKAAVFPPPSHSTVWSEAAVVMFGSTLSSMVKVAVTVLALPHSSVAVKVTVADPVAPQPLLKDVKSLVQAMSASAVQLSVADAPAWLSRKLSNSIWLPAPSHSAV